MADIKLPFGLKDEILVHISQVQQGLACGCVCVCCKKPLVARKGPLLVHHFAHYRGAECVKAVETALHLAAKGILADRREIRLPAVEIRLDYGPRVLLSPEKTFALNDVQAECRTGDIVPDILARCGTTWLMIEVRVTHPVDQAKLKKIRELGISALEIDLSSAHRTFSQDELCDAIVNQTANKQWLFNVKSDEWKQVLLRSGEKIGTVEGDFATRVGHCPINVRKWMGDSYAKLAADCWSCEFLLDVGENNDFIICGGEHKIRTFDELRHFPSSSGGRWVEEQRTTLGEGFPTRTLSISGDCSNYRHRLVALPLAREHFRLRSCFPLS